jgi:hypothetical protein
LTGRNKLLFDLGLRGQLFPQQEHKTLSVAAERVNNPDRSPLGIDG